MLYFPLALAAELIVVVRVVNAVVLVVSVEENLMAVLTDLMKNTHSRGYRFVHRAFVHLCE